jgi:hypothetical protein
MNQLNGRIPSRRASRLAALIGPGLLSAVAVAGTAHFVEPANRDASANSGMTSPQDTIPAGPVAVAGYTWS